MTDARRTVVLSEAWGILLDLACEHARELVEETPVRVFLALLGDGFAGKRAYLEARGGGAPGDGERWGWEATSSFDRDVPVQRELRHPVAASLLGSLDADWLLLFPEATYQFVQSAARAAGGVFPVELPTLLRRLDEAGLIATEPGSGRRTPKVWTGQGTRRVIKLRRSALDASAHPDQGEWREGRDVDAGPIGPTYQDNMKRGGDLSTQCEAPVCEAPSQTMPCPHIPPIPQTLEESNSPSLEEEVFEWAATL
jgi:hypothetical protein